MVLVAVKNHNHFLSVNFAGLLQRVLSPVQTLGRRELMLMCLHCRVGGTLTEVSHGSVSGC